MQPRLQLRLSKMAPLEPPRLSKSSEMTLTMVMFPTKVSEVL
jgi:hypothetical protein